VDLLEAEVDGCAVRYRTAGAGEPLVLVHGLAGSWRWWSPIVGPLAERRRVLLVDLPRLRHSNTAAGLAAWLGHWLEAAAPGPVDVAGHSLGGLVAAELAARGDGPIRRLVLVAPAGIPCGRRVASRVLPLAGELVDIRAALPTVVADALRARPLPLVRGIAYVSRRDLSDVLPRVRVPTLLAWGERDRLVPIRIAEEWLRLLPDARLARLPCGHVPMLESPPELASAVLAFLGEQVADDVDDQVGPDVVDRMRRLGDDDESAAR
jgi:pimeloyl-ACP methyl ester carboxylesterase